MTTLRETLADHVLDDSGCWCGLPEASPAKWSAHLESVVLAWVGARLAGARGDVSRAIERAAWTSQLRTQDGLPGISRADAALTALRDALGVPVAPAGGEVAPGATGGVGGRESDAEGVRERNRRVIDHEIRTPMRGHDEGGECCRKAAGICEACPFLGCPDCPTEATNRDHQEAK